MRRQRGPPATTPARTTRSTTPADSPKPSRISAAWWHSPVTTTSSGIARILGLAAKEDNVVANVSRDLDEIDSLTPQAIDEEEAGVSFNDPKRPRLGSDGKYYIRPGMDNDVKIEDPNDLSKTITDIDRVDNGVLWEEKSATNAGDVQRWVDKQVTKKLDSYVEARQYVAGMENAPIGIEFTNSGADPGFRSAVEAAVADARARHPGVTILIRWAQ